MSIQQARHIARLERQIITLTELIAPLKAAILRNEGMVEELRDRLSKLENKRGPGRPPKTDTVVKVNDA